MLRTHTCGELTARDVGKVVTLAGWVHKRRDHGGLLFVDLRDRYGVTQVTFDPKDKTAWKISEKCRSEYVIQVTGTVVERPKAMVNLKISTGEIEVAASAIEVLNTSETPPFEIAEDQEVNEELRLKYRFLDLRHPRFQKIMADRDRVIQHVRDYFHEKKFVEVQTPILANSSPEGARDYLVPSRLYPGKFYALPQAPQQFKQLLMVAGLDRYFQIAPCFRDEDPRADRHPGEFYQIDLEMSFVRQEDVWEMVEPLMIELTEKFSEKSAITKPFPRLPYKEAVSRYGSDKPDLRFDMELVDVSSVLQKCAFKVFQSALAKQGRSQWEKGVVYALPVKGGAQFSRSVIDELTEIAKQNGAGGLAYIIVEKEPKSPILKFLKKEEVAEIVEATKAKTGDIIFFGADTWRVATKTLGAVRSECGNILKLKDPSKAAWLWMYDYPMYDYAEDGSGKIDFSHNPFSMPQGGLEALNTKDPLDILAYQYDLVCNGFEVSSGAIRNHRPDVMYRAFEIAGYAQEEVDAKFGHMIKAFSYGAPPHGGIAPGLDRILMMLWECSSIRDIYAFPKSGSAQDLMLGAPSEVTTEQLRELRLTLQDRKERSVLNSAG